MKIQSATKRTLGVAMLLMSMGLVKAQSAAPAGFPQGNETAKKQWIQSNPDAYRAMGGQIQTTTPPVATEKKSMTDKEKAVWIANNPAEYSKLAGASNSVDYSLMPGYPQYVNTGNPAKDMENYNRSKSIFNMLHGLPSVQTEAVAPALQNTGNPVADMIRYNEAKVEYKKANGLPLDNLEPAFVNTGNAKADAAANKQIKEAWLAKSQNATAVPALDNVGPAFVNTGNAKADADANKQIKEAWLAKNPNGTAAPAKVHMTKAEFQAFPAQKQQAILKDPNYVIGQ